MRDRYSGSFLALPVAHWPLQHGAAIGIERQHRAGDRFVLAAKQIIAEREQRVRRLARTLRVQPALTHHAAQGDRHSGVEGKSVSVLAGLGGCVSVNKKKPISICTMYIY